MREKGQLCAKRHAICFLHRGYAYTGEIHRAEPLAGTQSSVVSLAEALAARGHTVTVGTSSGAEGVEYGVAWSSSQRLDLSAFDAVIGVTSPKQLQGVTRGLPILWSHNRTTLHRQLKSGNIWAVLRHRPHLVVLGPHHWRNIPRALPFRSRTVITHGMTPAFFREEPANSAPPPRAIFTSQAYRGLDFVRAIWPEVRAQVPDAQLHVFSTPRNLPEEALAEMQKAGIFIRKKLPRGELALELRSARVALIPGHVDETYCLAAAEATVSGLPIVTMGIGALGERVQHNVTGFVAASRAEFVARTVELLREDSTWEKMHRSCLEPRWRRLWDDCAQDWEVLIASLLSRHRPSL